MAKTYTAISVGLNHDVDVQVDSQGNITAWVLNGEINYGTMGRDETLDVWPLLNPGQQTTLQLVYDNIKQLFNDHFLGP